MITDITSTPVTKSTKEWVNLTNYIRTWLSRGQGFIEQHLKATPLKGFHGDSGIVFSEGVLQAEREPGLLLHFYTSSLSPALSVVKQ